MHPNKRMRSNNKPTSNDRILSAKDLGRKLRAKREALGWTLEEASGWLNVGPRFLLELENGKNTVQWGMAFEVAQHLGVRLAFETDPINLASTQHASHPKPISESTPSANLGLALLNAMGMNQGIGQVPVGWVEGGFDRWCSHVKPLWSKGLDKMGFPDLIKVFRSHEATPLSSVATLTKWLIVSTAMADSQLNPSRIRLAWPNDGPERFVLQPFGQAALDPQAWGISPTVSRLHAVGESPQAHLRADQWVAFAKSIQVHPKVVFQILRQVGKQLPGLLDLEIDRLQKTPPQGPLLTALKTVRGRSERMAEVTMLAERQVAGLKTKKQPRIEPVSILYSTPKKVTHHVINDD